MREKECVDWRACGKTKCKEVVFFTTTFKGTCIFFRPSSEQICGWISHGNSIIVFGGGYRVRMILNGILRFETQTPVVGCGGKSVSEIEKVI